jgi:hypothetical protein
MGKCLFKTECKRDNKITGVTRECKHTSRKLTERKNIGNRTGAEVTVLAAVAVVVKLN